MNEALLCAWSFERNIQVKDPALELREWDNTYITVKTNMY